MVDLLAPVVLRGPFLQEVKAFQEFGTATKCWTEEGIGYFENEFWTSGQRRGHPLQEVSYRACFKPQLPEFFISRLTREGECVLDPFMGRGTTPLQAALMGRRPIGNDVNPLSSMLVRPRLQPPSQVEVDERLADIDWNGGPLEREDLLAFFHPTTLCAIQGLRRWMARRSAENIFDSVDDWIRMVALNRLTGHSAGFLSGYTLPPNQAVSVQSQLRINERLGLQPPERDVASLLSRKTRSLLRAGAPPVHPPARLGTGPACSMAWLEDGCVDLVVTSPPFLDVVNYAGDNWLRCWFAGIEAGGIAISSHASQEDWSAMVHDSLLELARIVRPGGHVAFEVGEVHRGTVMLERLVWQAAADLPFARLAVLVNSQVFEKTSNLWLGPRAKRKADKEGGVVRPIGTNTNRIVVLQRL